MSQTTINNDLTTANIVMIAKDTKYTKIFVGGLPYHTTDESLREHFQGYGDIEEAVVITDRQTGKSKGYGFVTMTEPTAAERACKDPNPIIDGRKANVNLAYIGAKPRAQPSHPALRSLPHGVIPASQITMPLPLIYPSALTGHYLAPNSPAVVLPSGYPTAYLTNPQVAGAYINPLMHPSSVPASTTGGSQIMTGNPAQVGFTTASWPYSFPAPINQIVTSSGSDTAYGHLVAQVGQPSSDGL